jgi:hypothetical protein
VASVLELDVASVLELDVVSASESIDACVSGIVES